MISLENINKMKNNGWWYDTPSEEYVEIIAYRYGGNFDEFGGVAPKAVYSGDGVEGKQIARGLEQRLYEGDLKATGGDTKKVANRQNPVGVKNPNRDKYLAAADEHLKTKGFH